jgi:hypothetical protein
MMTDQEWLDSKAKYDAIVASTIVHLAFRWSHHEILDRYFIWKFLPVAKHGTQPGSNGRVFVTESYRGAEMEEVRSLWMDRLRVASFRRALNNTEKVEIFSVEASKEERYLGRESNKRSASAYQMGLTEAATAIKTMGFEDLSNFRDMIKTPFWYPEKRDPRSPYPSYVNVNGLPENWMYCLGVNGGRIRIPNLGEISARGAMKAAGFPISRVEY